MSRTIKTNKQLEREKSHGKIAYRKRVIEEKEAENEIAFVFFNELSTENIVDRTDKNKICFINCGDQCNCK